MAIDPSIPLQFKGFSLSDIMADAQNMRVRDAQIEAARARAQREQDEMRQGQEKRSALADMIATRGPNGFDTTGDAFQRYTQAAPEDAFEMLGKLDERKRAEAKAGLEDMAAAVQWADTPQKWAVVQQHYGKFDPQLAAIPFEAREQSLLQLGQMGDYLKNTAPKIMSIEAGGSLAAVDPRTGRPSFTVLPNPGGAQTGAPAQGAPPLVADEASYNALPAGAAYTAPDGTIRRKSGGQTPQASGNFPGNIRGLPGERVTSTKRSAAHNKRVGGVPRSYHLTGQARDSVPPPGMSMAAYAAQLQRLNPQMEVINEGDHVHMEPRG